MNVNVMVYEVKDGIILSVEIDGFVYLINYVGIVFGVDEWGWFYKIIEVNVIIRNSKNVYIIFFFW